ncbi:MAG: sulfatase-like hydrolase/transferase [Planctomycetota bacterium JB042]
MLRPPLPLALLLLAATTCSKGPPPTRDVDILLCVVDTLRADRLGCYGYDRATSPTIDALAARGVRAADCTAQSSWTGPSMVSMMLSRHVADDFVRMPGLPTLAERLQALGWSTAAIQSNVLLEPGSEFERGFDEYEMEPDPDVYRALVGRKVDRPRFVYLHLTNPHDPYDPAAAYDVFPPRPVEPSLLEGFREVIAAAHPDRPKAWAKRAALEASNVVATERAKYDGEVRMADAILATTLEMLPRPEKTIVIVAADHGECLYEHREARGAVRPEDEGNPLVVYKRTHNTLLTQELVHVPLILAGPGVPAGVVLDAPVENVDLVPTLLELIGAPPSPDDDGASLVPAFADPAGTRGKDFVFSNTTTFSAVRARGGAKLVVPWAEDGPDRPVLFDLANDPHERAPLPTTGDDAVALRRVLDRFRAEALKADAAEDVIDEAVRRRMEELGYLGR